MIKRVREFNEFGEKITTFSAAGEYIGAEYVRIWPDAEAPTWRRWLVCILYGGICVLGFVSGCGG